MSDSALSPPALEPRFLQPDGWRWGTLANAQGRRLRFGTVTPANGKPDAIVVALPGLSEFSEKYFEIARDMLGRNYSFWVLDWLGQGKSDRYPGNPHKRHTAGFDQDIADLHLLVSQHVRPSAPPNGKTVPLVILAHSMGGNIALRYLAEYPGIFAGAALSTPMLGIHAVHALPLCIREPLAGLLNAALGTHYIFGGGDWHPDFRDEQAKNILSSDPVRREVHGEWCLRDPALQVGNITFGWLYEALVSCRKVNAPGVAESIATPCLFGIAERDKLVDNRALLAFARRVKGARILELADANHEILMERDDIRDKFLKAFDELVSGIR